MVVATTVAEYLAALPVDQREALRQLSAVIEAAVPGTVQGISYGVPSYKYLGRSLVSLGAGRNHCSFFVQSPEVMQAFAEDLKGFDTAKGTVHFQPGQPIPDELVRKLVRARIDETAAAAARRRAKR
jgi:uncharacterized protein YdhG (YjbR/CyaY superfamily)